MKIVQLYELVGCALIIPSRSGVVFTNQAGGYACTQPELEGILIPLNNDYPINDNEDTLEFKISDIFTDSGWGTLTQEQVRQIDAILQSYPETKGVSINYNKLDKSEESWLWVNAIETKHSSYKGFGNFEAILTWPNSD